MSTNRSEAEQDQADTPSRTEAFVFCACVLIIAAGILAVSQFHRGFTRGVQSQQPRITQLDERVSAAESGKAYAEKETRDWIGSYEQSQQEFIRAVAVIQQQDEYIQKDKRWHAWHDSYLQKYEKRIVILGEPDAVAK